MPQNPAVYQHLSDHYLSLPHCRAIDLQAVCTEHDQPVLSVANRADLAGRSQEGTIHGGVITALDHPKGVLEPEQALRAAGHADAEVERHVLQDATAGRIEVRHPRQGGG